ncbi:hypothetical protein EJ07DRAFT_153094 [Lizonia empirigonia]|nr:hypothetical protein EJ07DRAFT_153094 [Lizonia empirigonia]
MLRRANGPTPRFLDPSIVVRPTSAHLLHNFCNNFCKGLTAIERPKNRFVERFVERGSAESLSAVQTANSTWSSRGYWSSNIPDKCLASACVPVCLCAFALLCLVEAWSNRVLGGGTSSGRNRSKSWDTGNMGWERAVAGEALMSGSQLLRPFTHVLVFILNETNTSLILQFNAFIVQKCCVPVP